MKPFFLRLIEDSHPWQDSDESQISEDLDIGREVNGIGCYEIGNGEESILRILIIIEVEVLVNPPNIEDKTDDWNQVGEEDQGKKIIWIDNYLQNDIWLLVDQDNSPMIKNTMMATVIP